ncbi:MAG: hypothetical protein HGA51_01040, partial [Demequinaceae bacterium]|nr:hypothetical protein [Demequinaceae bacterium]
QFHQGRDAFERDRVRDRLMLARGMPVMRLTARELRSDPHGIVTQIANVVGRPVRRDAVRRLDWVFGSADGAPARS